MKIAFLELSHVLDITRGDVSLMISWYNLLKNKFEVDLVQYDETLLDNDTNYEVIHINSIREMDKYDVVLINNIANDMQISKDAQKVKEFADFVYNLKAKTIYVDHNRPNFGHFIKQIDNFRLSEHTDCTFTYYKNVRSLYQDESKLKSIETRHFYKPIEYFGNCLERDIDFTFLNRPIREKGAYSYFDFLDKLRNIDKEFNAEMHGWIGSIAYMPIRKHHSIIQCMGKSIKKNSDDAFIKLYGKVKERSRVGEILSRAKISWNAYDFTHRRYNIENIIDIGLEATPLESLMYGCIPIVHNIHKDCKIYFDPKDFSRFMRLEDLNCCFFTDGQNFESLMQETRDQEIISKKQYNVKLVADTILKNSGIYFNSMVELIEEVYNSNYNRKYTEFSTFKEFTNGAEIIRKYNR